MSGAPTVIATYRVRPGSEAAFEHLLARHGEALAGAGVVSDAPRRVYTGSEVGGARTYWEIFEWRDDSARERAQESSALREVWNAMSELLEPRGGRPKWEFPLVEPLEARR